MIKEFKIRASACGQIMTNNRKGDAMGETSKTYCENWLKEQIYSRRKEIKGKYLYKGNQCEDESIEYVNGLWLTDYKKNTKFFESEHMTGTPDIIENELVIDIKNSWDCFTFPLFDTEIDKNYYYQLQCYMHLTGAKKATLCYTLMNMPEEMIEKEAYYNGVDILSDCYADFRAKYIYDSVASNYRVKCFNFDYEPLLIAAIETRVIECREYIKTLI